MKDKTASFRAENWRFWSEWQDSNSLYCAHKSGTLQTGLYPDVEFETKYSNHIS